VVGGHIDRQHRVQQARVKAGLSQGRPHACDIHQRGAAGRIVHQHPTRQEGDFRRAPAGVKPVQNGRLRPHRIIPRTTQDILQKQPVKMRQPAQSTARSARQIDNKVLLPVKGHEGRTRHLAALPKAKFRIMDK
jgi:hypothetical protein